MNIIRKIYWLVFVFILIEHLYASINIKIQYSGQKESLPNMTRKIFKQDISRYQNFLGIEQSKSFNIDCIIASNKKEFAELLGHNTPDWLAGVMDYRDNKIILKSPEFDNISHQQYERTIKHELVHYLQNTVVPLSITPNWFDEGIAEYLVKSHDIRSQIILSRALNQEKLIPLDKLNFAINPNRTKSRLAYSESASLVDFLVIAYGEEAVRKILKGIRKGLTFAESWKLATGMNYDYLDFHWKKYIKKRYKYIFLLDFKYLIWLIMPVLVILGYVIKKITNQKIKTRWDEEDLDNETESRNYENYIEISDNDNLPDKPD
jgi:hypothetical protein